MLTIDGGRETGTFQVAKWDTHQIAWTTARDYDTDRLLLPGQEPDHRHFSKYNCLPFEVRTDYDCNQMTAAGWQLCIDKGAWLGTAGTLFSSTVGRIGLGTGGVTNYNDTALASIGSLTTPNWVVCGVAPTYTAASGSTPATMVFTATFITTAANGTAVTEFAVDQGTSNTLSTASVAPMVNHGACTAGTKTSAQTWNVTATLTFT